MIAAAVDHIALRLNDSLRRTFSIAEDVVVVSNVHSQDGTVVPNIENKLVVFLVNIEKDSLPGKRTGESAGLEENGYETYPPIHLNLDLMFAANFSGSNYSESLKFISHTIGYFQKSPVFTHQNSPGLDDRIEKLIMGIKNLNIQDASTLWGVLSGKYMPSVLYQVRMVTFDAEDIRARRTAIRETEIVLNP